MLSCEEKLYPEQEIKFGADNTADSARVPRILFKRSSKVPNYMKKEKIVGMATSLNDIIISS